MTFREIEYWLRAAQIECQRTVFRQITLFLAGIGLTWCLLAFVVGTPNPLLLFNPNFQPSLWVRIWSLWCIALLGCGGYSAIKHATLKSHELRLGLHPSTTYLNHPPAPDALFFESEKNQ